MGCFRLLIRVFFFLSYIILIVAVIALIIFALNKVKEYTALTDEYNIVSSKLSLSDNELQKLKSELSSKRNETQESTQKIKNLESELNKQSREGLGEIKGRISGQLLGGDVVSQYQFVCAQNTKNTNLQYCLNVSSITQNYSIILPAGTYRVFAKATNNNNIVLNDYSGIYSQYIKCLGEKPQNECDQTKLQGESIVEVKVGSTIEGVNPIDWQKTTK